jgi:hypothetical protein
MPASLFLRKKTTHHEQKEATMSGDESMLGPKYSYADELAAPSELGITRDGSVDGIFRAVAGVNYYVDAIGFGESTMLARSQGFSQTPLGVRFFTKTGAKCSNGADMYEYVDTLPRGLSGRIGNEVRNVLGVDMRGMAPGIIQDAVGALDPRPMYKAVTGSGYPKCKKVTLPVGDAKGRVRSAYDGTQWISGAVEMRGGQPHQSRWVYDSDLTQEAYAAAPKTEGFASGPSHPQIAAGVLCAAAILGTMMYWK